MQQKRLDNILYVFQVEPYIITDDIEDVSYIYVEQDSLDGFKELNPDLKLTGWNYSMYSVFEPPYAKYINTDDLVMEFENTSVNVSSYVDEDYTGTVQDVSYTPEDASVTFTYFLGDTSLNSSTFTLDSSGSYTITAKLDPNEIYDPDEISYSLNYQKEKRTAELSFTEPAITAVRYEPSVYVETVQPVNNLPQGQTVNYYKDGTKLNTSTLVISNPGQHEIVAKLENSSIYNDASAAYTIDLAIEKRTVSLSWDESTVVSYTGEEGEILTLDISTLNITPLIPNEPIPEILNVSNYITYYLDDDAISGSTTDITIQDGSTDYVISARLENCPGVNDASCDITINVQGETSDYSKKYLTIEPLEAGTFSLGVMGSGNCSYSIDNGNTWLSLASDVSTNELQPGQKMLLKGDLRPTTMQTGYFKSSGEFNISGNIKSLFFGDDFKTAGGLTNNFTLTNFFQNSASVLNSQIISAENLILPNDFSGQRNMDSMFAYQRKMIKAPKVVQSTGISCCQDMFKGCTSLTEAPELPATSVYNYSYSGMFYDCTSLTTAPAILPATTVLQHSYDSMFRNCTSLTTTPVLPATLLNYSCYQNMFNGCTSLTEAPELPVTSISINGYAGMFQGCTSLTEAPELPAIELANNCYQNMFNGCTSLTEAPELPATNLKDSCYEWMFNGCTSLTTAPELPATTLKSACYAAMFAGCTSLTTAPELPATDLAFNCYANMFKGCTRLNYINSNNKLFTQMQTWTQNVAVTGTFVLGYGDQNYWNTNGVVYGPDGIPTGWVIKDANGNTFTPKIVVNLTWVGDPLTTTVNQGSQSNWNYAVTPNDITNITYSKSTDGGTTWTVLGNAAGSISLDTTTIGIQNFKIKASVVNDPKYAYKEQIFDATITVKEVPDLELSHYTRLDLIDSTLYNTAAVDFNDVILDLSESLTTQNNVFVNIKDTVTGATSDSYNGVRTYSAAGSSDFNLRENTVAMKIQNAGVPVTGHSGFYAYKFSNLMRIRAVQSSVRKDKVYFKIPRVLKATYSVEDTTTPVQILPYNTGGTHPGYRTTIYSSMKIDGVEQQTMQGEYLFTTQGDHVVEYTLTNNAEIPAYGLDFYNLPQSSPQQILSEVIIPYGVTTIKNYAFRNCDYLSTINIPDSVTTLGESIFKDSNIMNIIFDGNPNIEAIPKSMCNGCAQLSSIIIPDSVTSIGNQAFIDCSDLTYVTIGNAITSIGYQAFYNCTGLLSITVNGVTPPTLTAGALNNTNDCPIYVPANSVTAYQTATNWSDYASRIQAIP